MSRGKRNVRGRGRESEGRRHEGAKEEEIEIERRGMCSLPVLLRYL